MTYSEQVVADGATHYWRFSEATGLVLDSVGGAHGTIAGVVGRGVPGALADGNPAIDLQGAGSVSLPTISLLVTFSLEVWVKQAAPHPTDFIWTNRLGGDLGLVFLYLNNGRPQFGDALAAIVAPSGSVADNQWHHVVGTSSGSALELYVDGALVVTKPYHVAATSGIAGIGEDYTGFACVSQIDEVATYPVVLTPAQIAHHYALRLGVAPTHEAPYPAAVRADGAAHYWRLNEPSGPVAADALGGVPGTIVGGVTRGRPGPLADGSTAMGFDGTTGKITIPTLTLSAPMTVEAWGRFAGPDLAPRAILCNQESGASDQPLLFAAFTGVAVLSLFNVGNAVGVARIDTGTWHHLVATNDGIETRLYVDGVPDNDAQAMARGASTHPAVIGWNPTSPTVFWVGDLAEIAVYSRLLTPAQIAAHYTLRLATGAATAPPVPWLAAVALPF